MKHTNKQQQKKEDLRVLVWHQNKITQGLWKATNIQEEVELIRMRSDAVPCLIPEGCCVQVRRSSFPKQIHVLRSFLYNLQCHNCQSFSWVEVLIYPSSERIFNFVYWWQNSSTQLRESSKEHMDISYNPNFIWSHFILVVSADEPQTTFLSWRPVPACVSITAWHFPIWHLRIQRKTLRRSANLLVLYLHRIYIKR